MSGERKRTPIPNRDIEAKSTGSGSVKPYKLTPKELQELWKRTGPPGTINGRPSEKKATAIISTFHEIDISPEKQRERAVKSHANAKRKTKYDISKEFVITEFKKGKTVAKIEQEQNMSKGSLFYYLKKWGIRSPHGNNHVNPKEDENMLTKEEYLKLRLDGLNRTNIQRTYFPKSPPKFYEQLDTWGIKKKDAEDRELDLLQAKPEQEAVPIPSEDEVAVTSVAAESELIREKDDLIARLKQENRQLCDELSKVVGERNQCRDALGNAKSEIEQLKGRLQQTENDREMLLATIEKAASPRSIVKGVGKDSPTVTNRHGGKQSEVIYRFDLLDPQSMFEMTHVLSEGAKKYGGDENWRRIPVREHLNHLLIHAYAYLAGDQSDEHLSHIMCRSMFAQAVEIGEVNAE